MNVVLFDWPSGKVAVVSHGHVRRGRHHRLGQRGVGAPVDQARAAAARGPRPRSAPGSRRVWPRPARSPARRRACLGRDRSESASPSEAGTLQFGLLMATFDQLSAEQRAILELVLQQQKSYDELAGHARHARGAGARTRSRRPGGAGSAERLAVSRRTGAGSSPTTCSASSRAPRPPPPRAICAARSRRAPGRARCSTRWSSSTSTGRCRPCPRASADAAGRGRRLRAPAMPVPSASVAPEVKRRRLIAAEAPPRSPRCC